jgi:sigma-B regulation protein RsbU (phosphoserine phosphatase)
MKLFGGSSNIMLLMAPQIDAADVVRAFRHDSLYLFSGAAIISLGMLASAFAIIRREYDALLVYFAVFASLYGLRLWLQADLVKFVFHESMFFSRFSSAVNYLMPVPALFFLRAAGLLRQLAKIVLYIFATLGVILAASASIFGPSSRYDRVNEIAVTIALLIFAGDLLRPRPSSDRDLVAVRRGLLVFVACALFDNAREVLSLNWAKIEPFGFIVFLGSLGYVAARRTLQREGQLNKIQEELEVAKRIQLSILPPNFPSSRHFHVAARYVPMTSVAGDFYDYVLPEPNKAGFLIADVSGHGVPAALIASMVKLAAGSQRANAAEPGKFLSGMNSALCGNTQGQFVTAAYLHVDSVLGQFRYSAAGHPPMLLLREGTVQQVEENGLILAAFDFASYSEVNRPLRDGDRMLLYTDGIIEASDRSGEFFGSERLSALLLETSVMCASEATDKILTSVREWSVVQEDDLTVIVCDFRQ